MNKEEIRELNERLARFEFGDNFIGFGVKAIEEVWSKSIEDGLEYVNRKPLYTSSVDSCLPLLEKLGVAVKFCPCALPMKYVSLHTFDQDDTCFISRNKDLNLAFAIAIDKAINELKSEGK